MSRQVERGEKLPTQTITVEYFIQQIFPETKNTLIPFFSSRLIAGLEPCCDYVENQGFNEYAQMRGGSMRKLFLSSQDQETRFKNKLKQIPQEQITDPDLTPEVNELSQKVMEHIAQTDCDLFFHRKKDYPSGLIGNQLASTLIELGFQELSTTQNRKRFVSNQYIVDLTQFPVGTRTIFNISFKPLDPKQPTLFELSMIDYPTTTEQQKAEIRQSADLDQLGIGHINNEYSTPIISYERFDILSQLDMFLAGNYFTGYSPRFLAGNLLQTMSEIGRETGFRSVYFNFLLLHKPVNFDMFRNFALLQNGSLTRNLHDDQIFIPLFDNWIVREKEKTLPRIDALVGDIAYGIFTNPFVALPMLYHNRGLLVTPLGRLIHNEDILLRIYNHLAQKIKFSAKHNLFDLSFRYEESFPKLVSPLDIIDALKELGLVHPETPRKYGTILALLNPLNLIPENRENIWFA